MDSVERQLSSDDEIDLFELVETLWKEKFTLIGVTAFSMIVGVAYAFLAIPTYEVQQRLLEPKIGQVVELNKFAGAPAANQIFERMQQIATSQEFKQELLGLPVYEAIFESEQTLQQRLRVLDELLKIGLPAKASKDVTVTINYNDPGVAAKLLSATVDMLAIKTRDSVKEDIELSSSASIEQAKEKMQAIKAKYGSDLEAEIARLKEALGVASAANIIEPAQSSELLREPSGSGQVTIVNEMRGLYRLGTRLLEAELSALKARKLENELLIPGLSRLQLTIEELSAININYDLVSPFWSRDEVLIPERPIKPKKALIVALATILGGMLSVVFVLIRQAVRNRRVRSENS